MNNLRRLGSWTLRQLPNRYVGNVLSWLGLLYVPLEQDVPLREAIFRAWRRPLSGRVGWLNVFGAVSVVLVIILVLSGILLSFHYEPSQETARESVLYIMTDVTCGWLVRSVHRWASDLLIVLVFFHVIRTFFARAYRPPRGANWILGLLILPVILTFGFTGEILPWDDMAYWRSVRATELGSGIPIWGNIMAHVSGGLDLSNVTLVRYFAIHTIILPWVLFFLLAFHLRMVRKNGLTPPTRAAGRGQAADRDVLVVLRSDTTEHQVADLQQVLMGMGVEARLHRGHEKVLLRCEACSRPVVEKLALDTKVEEIVALNEAGRGTAFFPRHFIRVLSALLLLVGVLLLLSAWLTPIVGGIPDPFLRPETVHVKWYFLWFDHLMNVLPAGLGFLPPLLFGLIPLLGLLWPLIDRHDGDVPRRPWLTPVVGLGLLVLFAGLTLWGVLS